MGQIRCNTHVPILGLQQCSSQAEFQSCIFHRSHVGAHILEPGSRTDTHPVDGIHGLFMITTEIQLYFIVYQSQVHPVIQGIGSFPFQIGISQ